MKVNIDQSWQKVLQDEFDKDYFKELVQFVKQEYQNTTCYPPGNLIFNAFDHCLFDDTKVVVLGQDPYHGKGQAQGLCFSVPNGIAQPPSLENIFKEIEQDIGKPRPNSGDLTRWADQGILLLNATLTVRAHQAGSHQGKGWEKFTNRIIELLSDRKENLVFLLWGGFAKKKQSLIDKNKHLILTSGHPSPLSANKGYWFGNRHFSKTNEYLAANGLKGINW
ncbi:MAG: uracil-DNA glycosylase [Psychroflexus sp.]|jgi:uracil-DNA glycosylase|nr:uracil-DNA glycosylase [Psychroflexus sp.]MDR9448293.1 uracil-DNA glycosylase [Psychroflexus sp.]